MKSLSFSSTVIYTNDSRRFSLENLIIRKKRKSRSPIDAESAETIAGTVVFSFLGTVMLLAIIGFSWAALIWGIIIAGAVGFGLIRILQILDE